MDVQEAWEKGLCPMMVFDANGMEIKRKIKRFEEETGEVEYIKEDERGQITYVDETGDIETVIEFYPAPLTWKSNAHHA